jgi:hypothetical protein
LSFSHYLQTFLSLDKNVLNFMYKKPSTSFIYAKVLSQNEYFRGISCVSHWMSAYNKINVYEMFYFICYMKIWLAKIIKELNVLVKASPNMQLYYLVIFLNYSESKHNQKMWKMKSWFYWSVNFLIVLASLKR